MVSLKTELSDFLKLNTIDVEGFFTNNNLDIGTVPGVAAISHINKEGNGVLKSDIYLLSSNFLLTLDRIVAPHTASTLKNYADPSVLRLRQSESSIRRYDAPDLRQTVRALRSICFNRCQEIESGPKFQIKKTYGENIGRALLVELAATIVGHRSPEVTDGKFIFPIWPLQEDRASPIGVLYRGGDIFIIEPESGLIQTVARHFMDFVEDSTLFNYSRLKCTDCEEVDFDRWTSIQSDVPSVETLRLTSFDAPTPATLPGATTISPRELYRMQEHDDRHLVVVAAIDNQYGVPGGINMSFAAEGGTFDDEVQRKLLKGLRSAANGNFETPIVGYCLNKASGKSYNLGLRTKHLGYKKIYWLRDGVEGWIANGLPLTRNMKAADTE